MPWSRLEASNRLRSRLEGSDMLRFRLNGTIVQGPGWREMIGHGPV